MQIQGVLPSASVPLLPSAAPPQAAQVVDGFGGSAWTAPPRPEFEADAGAPQRANLGQRLALVAAAGLGFLAPMAFVDAHAAAPPISATVSEAERYGLSASTVEKLAGRPGLLDTLRSLPGDVASSYKAMSPAQHKAVHSEITGTTKIGFVKVNNRKAFVEGKALGVDALPTMLSNVEGRVKKGELTRAEGDQLKAMMTRMTRLTPAQREAVASVIELEKR